MVISRKEKMPEPKEKISESNEIQERQKENIQERPKAVSTPQASIPLDKLKETNWNIWKRKAIISAI